jgi:hypothetical protein
MSKPKVKTDKISISEDQIIRATKPQAIVEKFLQKIRGLENKKCMNS